MMPLALLAAAGAGCVPIEADRIVARDLAAQVPAFAAVAANTFVGYAPAPGARRVFNGAQLARLGTRYGITLQDAPDLCFERAVEPLTPQRVAGALEQALDAPGAPVEVTGFLHAAVPKGELIFPRSGLAGPNPAQPEAPRLWKGYVRYAGSKRFSVWATVRIPAGRLAGGVAVRRGDLVSVEVRIGAARLRLDGRAESTAARGDFISVRNIASGKLFRAKVEGKDQVGITLASSPDRKRGSE